MSPKHNNGLHWRIVAVLWVVSLLPLGLVGLGSWLVLGGLLKQKAIELHQSVVESQAQSIEGYLAERTRALTLVAQGDTRQRLLAPGALKRLLDLFEQTYGPTFVDLGIIGPDGDHLAYQGPHDLHNQNYAHAFWFEQVMRHGSHVSDVFLGFRQLPHCIIAVRHQEGEESWVLRATINSEDLDRIVQAGRLGSTGDAFLVDAAGRYQTRPRVGGVLDLSPLPDPSHHLGVLTASVQQEGRTLMRATRWLDEPRWLLVVHQEEAEVMAPVHRALTMGGVFVLAAVILLGATTFFATWHLTHRIDQMTAQRDRLSQDLMRSAKLASIGELSTGLAHEINNPLAIMSAEQTNMADLLGELPAELPARQELFASVACCKRQVERCGAITLKMLQFGRHTDPTLQPTSLGPRVEEITRLMELQARVRNVTIERELPAGLPLVKVDHTELEQVLVNIITNALHAMPQGGHIRVAAQVEGEEVWLTVSDTGCGIPPENLERVFQPFFTTKSHGTGLGLSVCYGIVRGWGGHIEAQSILGKGTTMCLRLPGAPSAASPPSKGA